MTVHFQWFCVHMIKLNKSSELPNYSNVDAEEHQRACRSHLNNETYSIWVSEHISLLLFNTLHSKKTSKFFTRNRQTNVNSSKLSSFLQKCYLHHHWNKANNEGEIKEKATIFYLIDSFMYTLGGYPLQDWETLIQFPTLLFGACRII